MHRTGSTAGQTSLTSHRSSNLSRQNDNNNNTKAEPQLDNIHIHHPSALRPSPPRRAAHRLPLLLLALAVLLPAPHGVDSTADGDQTSIAPGVFSSSSSTLAPGNLSVNLQTGLLARWSLARAARFNVAFDTSGYARHMLLHRARRGAAYPGLGKRRSVALLGQAQGGWALLPSPPEMLALPAWTLTAWVSAPLNSSGLLVVWRDQDGPLLQVRLVDGRLAAAYRDLNATVPTRGRDPPPLITPAVPTTSFPAADGTFHHLGVVYDAGQLAYYLDGGYLGMQQLPGEAYFAAAPPVTQMFFAGDAGRLLAEDTRSDALDLSLGETRVYARPLGLPELQTLSDGETPGGATPAAISLVPTCSWTGPEYAAPREPALPGKLYFVPPVHAWLETRCADFLLDDGASGKAHALLQRSGRWVALRANEGGRAPLSSHFLRVVPAGPTSPIRIAPSTSVEAAVLSFSFKGSETRLIWVRTTAATAVQSLLSYGGGEGGGAYDMRLNNGIPQVEVTDGEASATTPLAPVQHVADGAWHFIALVRVGRTVELYADNFRISRSVLPAIRPSLKRLDIGARVRLGRVETPFAGDLDNARIYNTALTLEEMRQLAQGSEVLRRQPFPATTPSPGNDTLAPGADGASSKQLAACDASRGPTANTIDISLLVLALLLAAATLGGCALVLYAALYVISGRTSAAAQRALVTPAPPNPEAQGDDASLMAAVAQAASFFAPAAAPASVLSAEHGPRRSAASASGVRLFKESSAGAGARRDSATVSYTAQRRSVTPLQRPEVRAGVVIHRPLQLPPVATAARSSLSPRSEDSQSERQPNVPLPPAKAVEGRASGWRGERASASQAEAGAAHWAQLRAAVTGGGGERSGAAVAGGGGERSVVARPSYAPSTAAPWRPLTAASLAGTVDAEFLHPLSRAWPRRPPTPQERAFLVLGFLFSLGLLGVSIGLLVFAGNALSAVNNAPAPTQGPATFAFQLPFRSQRSLFGGLVELSFDALDDMALARAGDWTDIVGVSNVTATREADAWLETGCTGRVVQDGCARYIVYTLCDDSAPPLWAPRNGSLIASFAEMDLAGSACDRDFSAFGSAAGPGCRPVCCEGGWGVNGGRREEGTKRGSWLRPCGVE